MTARALHRYGDHPAQVVERFAPAGEPRGTAAVFHGGFWRDAYDRHLMDDLCDDLAGAGWAAWNVEYRRLGGGGGWPATFEDVTASLDLVGAPVVTIGHSAGGHLALWAAGHPNVTRAVAQAGVVDLEAAIRLGLSRGAARELVGDGDLAACSPAARLPLGVPQLLVHGADDDTVPSSMSAAYAERARAAGDAVDTAILPGVGHFEHLDPRSAAWAAVREWL
ncbi:MAG TPA: alpha/beta hydrolase [Gaiellaceae bacterium]|nr:alpha/beta hydrolase [Gaiellaceae bacterium]